MNTRSILIAGTLGLVPLTGAAGADPAAELSLVREQLAQIKSDYQQRIAELERRLAAAESRLEQAERNAGEAEAMVRDLAAAPQPRAQSTPNAFNPGIGLVLTGTYGKVGIGGEDYAIPGFQLGGETGPGDDGFSLGESEFNFDANIDDKFFGKLTFALADEDGELAVELEEAWLQTTALPAGLTLSAGRFFSGIGYLNGFHRHADAFVDRPLPYQAFLAGQYLDDGLQLRWLAPTLHYLEFGAELLRGARFPGGGDGGQEAYTLFAKTGGDLGSSHSWKAGAFYLDADVAARSGGEGHGKGEEPDGLEGFAGDSELWGLEAVYKWAPQGNPAVRNLVVQGEYFERNEDGSFEGLAYAGDQRGWYLQGNYQFRPGWRIGYRHDRLGADNRGVEGTELDDLDFDPRRDSLILEWFNSEFSRVRMQYTRDRSTPIEDDQWFLQYIMALGSHRAHQF